MKQKFNLDKAKFCYKVPDGLFDYLSAYQIGDFICCNGYSLRVLSNDGNVYWWIRNEKTMEVSKMPFVTAEGLISEMGMSITSNNIAVRPIITIRR